MSDAIVYSKLATNDEWTETFCYNSDDVIETFKHLLAIGYTVKLDNKAQDLVLESY